MPASETESRRASLGKSDLGWSDGAAVLLLFLLAFLPYANTLIAGFVYDDYPQLVDNPYVQSFSHLREIFASNVWSFQGAQGTTNYYRPLMTFGYLLCYKLFGPLPFGFHLVNVSLHAAVVCLLFFLTRRLFGSARIAFLAAALFALHPIHTESVAWIAGVTDLELTFFYLLTFWFFLRLGDPDRHNSLFRYTLLTATYLLALLAKEQALTLPLLATLYEHFYRDDRHKTLTSQKLSRYGALWLMAAAYLLFRALFLGGLAPVLQRPGLSWSETILSALSLIAAYLWKLIWPVQLSAFYVFHKSTSLTDPRVITGICVVILCGALFCFLWKRARPPSFALLWLFVTLAPVLNARWMAANVFAERYLYLPSVGFCWLVAWGAAWLWQATPAQPPIRRRALAGSLFLIAALFLVRTVTRNLDWRDDMTLYTHTLQVSPDASFIRANLGTVYWRQGDASAAEREWQQALRQNPKNVVTLNNLGLLCTEQARLSEAVDYLNRAIALKPTYAHAHINLGITYQAMSQPDRALAEFRTAVALAPLNTDARYQLGKFLFEAGQLDEAREHFLRSVEASPTGEALRHLGEIQLRQGYREQAETFFRQALELEPFDARVHLRLGQIYAATGRTAEAAREFEAVLTTDPANAEAREALGMAPAAAPNPSLSRP